MRVALVSPYSWTYPGGVTRHIEALAADFMDRGHFVRVLAPFDPPDRHATLAHRGASPEPRDLPDHVLPVGRTMGFPSNGSISNIAATPSAVLATRRLLDAGNYDVVHLHEPVAPVVGWDALAYAKAPLVGTFHCYGTNRVSHGIAAAIGARRQLNRLRVRIAVSDAAAWTGRRFYGGRYRVIPNGVELSGDGGTSPSPRHPGTPLRIAFVGRVEERKGLPVLLRAFEALREHVPATLQIVGADPGEVAPLLLDDRGVTALGKASDERKRECLEEADVLCAPSLGGESFGMVLTEAFAAGTPVVASDIAGYRDVVRPGEDGILFPPGDATELAEVLRDLSLDPARRDAMSAGASQSARRYAWPRVADQVLEAYEDAREIPEPEGAARRAAVRIGALPSDGGPRAPARRLPTLEPAPAGGRRTPLAWLRRGALACAAIGALVLGALALDRIGLDNIGKSLFYSRPIWVIVGLALMCASMAVRAFAWHAILRAALPRVKVRLSDAAQGTFIGVLMSATLPARLGEPSRALIVARRLGHPRKHLPVVLGTLVSQTLLNILALVILGVVMLSTVRMFAGRGEALWAMTLAPVVVATLVLLAPMLLRRGRREDGHAAGRLSQALGRARSASHRVREGLRVFRNPRLGAVATLTQLAAWTIQWLSCYVLLVALGLDDRAGLGAAAAVLFAVNVTAVLPATPSNLGVFQAACVAVLTGAYHVSSSDALAYGIILQAVEIATAVIMGMPALVKEGVSWRDVRLRALHAAPVRLPETPRAAREPLEAEA
jgi:phosphatidyl-myo-inositol alpha-mannosyltransferase